MPRCVLKDAKVNFSLVLKSWICSDTTQRRTTKNVLFQETIQKEYPLTKVASRCSIKKLSQILANNIDNGGKGIGLRIYVRYCRCSIKIAGCIHYITLFFTINTSLT